MTFSIERLQAIKTIISHETCADGLASAMILKAALPEAKLKFVKYNSEEHEKLEAEEGMIFCDFSPHPTRTQDFIDVGAIVLDHHAKEVVEPFGESGVFADVKVEPGVSGAMLAYLHVYVPILGENDVVGSFASICGIYDTWQTKHPLWEKSREYTEALFFLPKRDWLKEPIFPNFQSTWDSKMDIGRILVDKKNWTVKKALEEAYRATVGPIKVIMVQDTTAINEIAEAADPGVSIVAGFRYYLEDNSDREDWCEGFAKNAKFKVSLRSRNNFNVRNIALHYGGGGHEKAASFVENVGHRHENPYRRIIELICDYLMESDLGAS
jgi:oligoribonuclease NrnB/cAMP/cGMP phosphodiesterase (DHH superfamily)